MSKNHEWKEDTEVMNIAVKLLEKYDEVFCGFDISKIRFIRELSGSVKKQHAKMFAVKYPFDIDSQYVYYFCTSNSNWKTLTPEQQTILVFRQMLGIPSGGTDSESENYAKIRRPDVDEYSEVLIATDGRFDWANVGVNNLKNILDGDVDEKEEKDCDEVLNSNI